MKRILAITLLSGCVSKPVEALKEVESPKIPVDHKEDVQKAIDVYSLEAIVNSNGCKDVSWKDRGKMPLGFYMGIAKTYAQSKCDKFLVEKLTRPAISSNDALKKYGLAPTMPNVFAFLVGLAARESTGKHCTGRDLSASFTNAWSAESGCWQTSLDSKNYASYLYPFFKNWNKKCFIEDYSRNVKCRESDAKIWGNNVTQYDKDGREFQIRSKTCPSFQAEYTGLVFRENLNHFGPIKRMEVQFKNECVDLFKKVDETINCEAP